MSSGDEYDLLAFEVEEAAKCDASERAGRPTRRTVTGRRMREKKPIADNDGRRRPRSQTDAERDRVQLNATVHKELKEDLVHAARVHGRSMVEMIEAAVREYLTKLNSVPRGRNA